MGSSRTLSLTVILILVLFVVGFVRPVKITRNHGSDTLWFWAWQEGRIEFIHSVTRRPVSIHFGIPWCFSRFSVRTDPGTEEYYTSGGYSWSEKLAKERTRGIDCCSEVGITLTLGGRIFYEQGGCLSASLLWPP
ncbi:MAG TPA: hypothetical protein VMV04_13760 [Thermodesulfobacteriota bacterium]|nr:hypothetical protein [Thermodesulfobacteriota bacterium]